MDAVLRILFSLTDGGTDADVELDSARVSPLTFDGVLAKVDQTIQVGPAVVDQAVALPACSLVVLISDEPVKVRLLTAETEVTVRALVIAGDDARATAFGAASIRLSGNGTNTAKVRIITLAKVT